jgi:Peptidase family M23
MLVLALLALAAPVPGDVTRGFDPGRPYEGGRHRGVDLAAAPGSPVRAACAGRVAFAGRIAGDGIVTLRCGPWRVTHMPLATIAARGFVARGAVIGTVARSPDHAGLHLGVRRDGTRFGYVDPLRFMAAPARPVPLGRAPRAGRRAPPAPAVRPRSRVFRPASPPLAPWPAWAGLALVLAGAGLRLRARRRAYSNPVVSPAER